MTLIVFPFSTFTPFCALQSRVHELWVRFLASSLEDDLRYTPSDCFETFPFPMGFEIRGWRRRAWSTTAFAQT